MTAKQTSLQREIIVDNKTSLQREITVDNKTNKFTKVDNLHACFLVVAGHIPPCCSDSHHSQRMNQYTENKNEPPYDKTNNVAVRPAKTQISLGICPV